MGSVPELQGEERLSGLFADEIRRSVEFGSWFLSRTKFAQLGRELRLLDDALYMQRPRMHWWRNWWCQIGEFGECEIDIFLVFENLANASRVALLIENKLEKSYFTPMQEKGSYRKFGDHKRDTIDFLNYQDYETIILAPKLFISKNALRCEALFDRRVLYEEVSSFIPAFETTR